ncbi:MAG: hypothetical protein ACPG5T_06775, partial [Endozoicomonas sp.]
CANDGNLIRRMAVNNRGIMYKSLMDVSQDIIEKNGFSSCPTRMGIIPRRFIWSAPTAGCSVQPFGNFRNSSKISVSSNTQRHWRL